MLALFYQHWYENKKTQVILYIDLIVAVSLFFLLSTYVLDRWLPLLLIQTMGFAFTEFVVFNISYRNYYVKSIWLNTIFNFSSNKTSEEISFALAPEDNSI